MGAAKRSPEDFIFDRIIGEGSFSVVSYFMFTIHLNRPTFYCGIMERVLMLNQCMFFHVIGLPRTRYSYKNGRSRQGMRKEPYST